MVIYHKWNIADCLMTPAEDKEQLFVHKFCKNYSWINVDGNVVKITQNKKEEATNVIIFTHKPIIYESR